MSHQLLSHQVSESKPVRLLGAIGAAATAAVTALAVIPGVPAWIPAAVGVVGLVLTVFVGKYTENRTVPWEDVAAKVTPTGRLISGPADEHHPTGASVALVTPPPSSSFQPGTSVYPEGEGDPL